MKAIDASKVYEFVVKDERDLPKKDQTVFLCKYLDAPTGAALGDMIYDVRGVGAQRKETLRTGTQQLTILRKCLKGWTNMRGENGQEVTFDEKRVDDMIDMIPPKYRPEVTDFIRGESEVSEGEEKS